MGGDHLITATFLSGRFWPSDFNLSLLSSLFNGDGLSSFFHYAERIQWDTGIVFIANLVESSLHSTKYSWKKGLWAAVLDGVNWYWKTRLKGGQDHSGGRAFQNAHNGESKLSTRKHPVLFLESGCDVSRCFRLLLPWLFPHWWTVPWTVSWIRSFPIKLLSLGYFRRLQKQKLRERVWASNAPITMSGTQ